jgi:peptidoglycan/xylan/chitin deacetylase (PgdA/CDA1 family)
MRHGHATQMAMMMTVAATVVGAAVCVSARTPRTSQAPQAAQAPQTPRADAARVALTFDDLPNHGPLPQGLTRVDIATRIIAALRQRNAPPIYGFINAKGLETEPGSDAVLKLWRAAGFPLGNHAFSHMDLHANPADAFEQDILGNETTLRTFMGDQDWHWFRYPYLREGDTADKYHAVRGFLKEHGYSVAEVTLSFDDYAYNEPYARCLAKGDTKGIEWLKDSYLTRAGESLTRGQEQARTAFGHDIPHIMLLHIGGFETVMVPRLLDLLQQRNFTLITLQEAAKDPAYAQEPTLTANWNGSLLQQWLTARHVPPAPRPSPSIFEQLSAVCR